MSLTLNHIPCPAGNNCTAFKCIFGHASDKPEVNQPQSSVQNAIKSDENKEARSLGQAGPRKRLKVDSISPRAEQSASTPKNLSSRLETLGRPISPPAVKRLKDPPSKIAKSQRIAASENKSALAAAKPAGLAKQKKAESLNPRLLKSSPASHEIRLKLVKMLHQEFRRLNTELQKVATKEEGKLVISEQDLIIKALDEEQSSAVDKPAVYSNVMKNKVMQYKRMKVAQWREERMKEMESIQKKRRQSDISDEPKKIETGLTTAQEIRFLNHVLTPVDGLTNHGYVASVPSEETLKKAREGLEAAQGWEKCDRCQQRFQVFPGRREDGALTSSGSCRFHWGKAYIPARNPLDEKTRQPKRFQCCGEEVGDSAGCFTHSNHVFKVNDPKALASLLNFAETPANALAPTDRAVCFDCEMGYTVHGLELIRLTATSWPTGEELLDVLVRPLGEILDLNSRYSGVWPDDLAQAQAWSTGDDLKPAKNGDNPGIEDEEFKSKKLRIVPSPTVARDLLFSLIAPTTPLIGHGLENDLNAVRIVHPTIIDTVLLYPHHAGLPFRYGLKMLMEKKLNRKIQQDTGPKMLGHDSAEDARAAGELVRLKVMEKWKDMQREGWKLVDGDFVSPSKESDKGKLSEEFIEA